MEALPKLIKSDLLRMQPGHCLCVCVFLTLQMVLRSSQGREPLCGLYDLALSSRQVICLELPYL